MTHYQEQTNHPIDRIIRSRPLQIIDPARSHRANTNWDWSRHTTVTIACTHRRWRSIPWGIAALVLATAIQAEPTPEPESTDPPVLHAVTPAVAFENAPGVLGISIRTLRRESIKGYATEPLGLVALGLEDLRLTPVNREGNISLNLGPGLQYTGTDYEIPKSSRRLLDGIARVLAENPDTEVQIFSHTDDRGDAGYNLRLSQRRADAARDYLIGRGVADSRISAIGRGEEAPLVDSGRRSQTRSQREKNHRTELIIKPLSLVTRTPEIESSQSPSASTEAETQDPAQGSEQ